MFRHYLNRILRSSMPPVLGCLLLWLSFATVASPAAPGFTNEPYQIPLSINVSAVSQPWCGGFSQPRPYALDIDGDGIIDLVIGDDNARLHYFHNIGTKSAPVWHEEDHPITHIDIGTWFCFADIDADNDPDLFCDSRHGTMQLWRQDRDSTGTSFLLKSDEFGGFVTGPYSSPDFADLDGDGDLDFFYGGIGGNLLFQRNIGDPFFPAYEFVSDFYDSIIAFPGGGMSPGFITPTGDVVNFPDTLAHRAEYASRISPASMHGFSTIRFGDIDADGDQDLFWGDINNNNLYLFTNQGGALASQLRYSTDHYLPSATAGFNNTTLADLDNDGDRDLIVGVGQNQDRNNLMVYPNLGTPFSMNLGTPVPLMIVLDFGSNGTIAMADLDHDGDLDFVMGSAQGRLIDGENVGTPTNPVFVLDTLRLAGVAAGNYTFPTLVDYDNDGDYDLFVGNLIGRIGYWRNDGGPGNMQLVQVTNQFENIKVDQLANLTVTDMDGDGLRDLVVGEWDFNGFANVLLYKNVGTALSPAYQLVHQATLSKVLREYTGVTVYDLDHNGRKDFVIGGQNGRVEWYRNISPNLSMPDSTTMILMPDTLPWQGKGIRMISAFGDLTGDGTDDAIVALDEGGLLFYQGTPTCCHQMGNVDNDPEGSVDIGDLTFLVDHLFITFIPLACPAQANTDGDSAGSVDIGDLAVLVDNLFITFAPLAGCQ